MRYLILIAVLLIPAWGWAGEFEQQFMVQDSDGTELLRCDEQAKHCYGPLLEQNTCYQRMREAMKAMRYFTPVVTGGPGDDLQIQQHPWGKPRETADMIYKADQLWKSTYQDCVEGR